MTLLDEYITKSETLRSLKPKNSGRRFFWLVVMLIIIALLVLWFTPWVQTAFGSGKVSTLSAQDRTQAISALVPGQIKQWHVIEGQRVKQGQIIVTLADQDPNLVSRLESQLYAVEQQRTAAEISVAAARQELQRKETLLQQGISSVRERDEAQIKLQDSLTKLAEIDADLNSAKTSLSRQSTQTKKAPTDGIITRLFAGGVATSVKTGDVLASFVPDNVERSVVVEVTGLDAPLIQPGLPVRLQFDGWPVFQFSGWPSTAVGTFGGYVDFVEPAANAQGTFNVWIREDKQEPWPSADFVRLDSRARAWVLLGEVNLGYEIWRQLNNFPPLSPNTGTQEGNSTQ